LIVQKFKFDLKFQILITNDYSMQMKKMRL
jgi:hypothetical protein